MKKQALQITGEMLSGIDDSKIITGLGV